MPGSGGRVMTAPGMNPGTPPGGNSLSPPGTGGAAPGAPGAGAGRIDPRDAARAKDATVFDPSNPIRALTNALGRQGIAADSANPVMRYIMSMAPGLATSFLAKGATGGFGTNPESITQGGGIGAYFSNFLQNALSGRGEGGGSLTSALLNPLGVNGGGSTGALQAAANAMHQMNSDLANNPAAATNPFTAQLRSMIGNDPAGGAGMIASLQTPFLGSYGRAYGDALGRRADRAYDKIDYTDPNNSDIFSYLLGMGR